MQVHDRDIAEFFLIALKSSDWRQQFVQLETIIAWVDEVILRTDIPPGWMLDLSIAKENGIRRGKTSWTSADAENEYPGRPSSSPTSVDCSVTVSSAPELFCRLVARNLGDDVDPRVYLSSGLGKHSTTTI
ncbi:MAG: hypothetical protein R3C56_08730 [Pirellulaceae bacterium]